jgi:chromosome segregation ATPase
MGSSRSFDSLFLPSSSAGSSDSSYSSNFLSGFPEFHATTHRLLQDVQVETKRYQLQRDAIDFYASIIDCEIDLQSEVRKLDVEISDIQLAIANSEAEFSQIKETRNTNILEIRKRLIRKLHKLEAKISDSDHWIAGLMEAVSEQRSNHEKQKANLLKKIQTDESELNALLERLTLEIDSVRGGINDCIQKRESDAMNAQTTIELIKAEMTGLSSESSSTDAEFARFSGILSELKREFLMTEESSECLREEIEFNTRLRLQMRRLLDRAKRQTWEAQVNTFPDLW